MRASPLLRPKSRLEARLKRLLTEDRGVAAVEFAMVLPVMVLLYLGMTELTFAVNTDRKLTHLSRTLADLTGREPGSTNATAMENIFSAATAVMAPYNSDGVNMVVSSIVVRPASGTDDDGNPNVKGFVCWSSAKGPAASPLGEGTEVLVPQGFRKAGSSFIRADVTMPYAPVFGSGVLQMVSGTATITLSEQTPWPVRNLSEIKWGTKGCLP